MQHNGQLFWRKKLIRIEIVRINYSTCSILNLNVRHIGIRQIEISLFNNSAERS